MEVKEIKEIKEMQSQVTEYFKDLAKYPKVDTYHVDYEDRITGMMKCVAVHAFVNGQYKAEGATWTPCDTLEEAIEKTALKIKEITDNYKHIWIRIMPEVEYFEGYGYSVRFRIAYTNDNIKEIKAEPEETYEDYMAKWNKNAMANPIQFNNCKKGE